MPYRSIPYLLMACWSLSGTALQARQRVKGGCARRQLTPQSGEPSASPTRRREVSGIQLSASIKKSFSGLVLSPTKQPLDAQPPVELAVVSSFRGLLAIKRVGPDGRRDSEILCPHGAALTARSAAASPSTLRQASRAP